MVVSKKSKMISEAAPTTQKERLTHLGYAYLGVGLAAQLLGALPALMRAAQARLEGCGCERGCPTCVHRSGCGDLNTSYSRFTLYSLLRAPPCYLLTA